MKRLFVAILMAAAVMWWAGSRFTSAQSNKTKGLARVDVLNNGKPVPNIPIYLVQLMAGKVRIGTTGQDGSSILDVAANPGKIRVTVTFKQNCQDPNNNGLFFYGPSAPQDQDCGNNSQQPAGQPPQKQCTCKPFGALTWDGYQQVAFDTGTGGMAGQGNGFPTWGYLAGGAAGVVLVAELVSGGSSTPGVNPTSTRPGVAPTLHATPTLAPTIMPTTGPGGTFDMLWAIISGAVHDPFTGYSRIPTITLMVNGSSNTITGPFPWVTVSGSFNSSTGAFTDSGTGTVAGYNNVPILVTGTQSGNSITITQLQLGPMNLPGNLAEVLSGTGTRR